MPKHILLAGVSDEVLRDRGVEAYSEQFENYIKTTKHLAGVRVNLPVYPAHLEMFDDQGIYLCHSM